ncbi:MAG: LLM class flavin-dependent oxidoreductase, partial [Acidimicrobiia bacterium]|nr:LLM class flavin-dependent oxidoreductase [Acidimicrobiia bacterium]
MSGRVSIAFQTDKPGGRYGELAAIADGYGFDVISVYSDLTFQPALPALLEIARATSRVRIGPACLNPFTIHPFEIAGQIAVLDAVSGGRAYLGLARGAWLEAIGIDQRHAVERVDEAWSVVSRLLAGDDRGFDGDQVTLAPGVALGYPRVRSKVPLLVGGWGKKMLRLAGRIADEAKVGGSANPEMVTMARRRLAVGEVESGRTPGTVGVVMGAVSVVDTDGERARSLARREVAMYLG